MPRKLPVVIQLLDGKRRWRRFPRVLFWRFVAWPTPASWWNKHLAWNPTGFGSDGTWRPKAWAWIHANWYAAEERLEGRM